MTLLIAALAVVSIFGFIHEQLYAQSMWAEDGVRRFALYALVYWSVAGVLLWRKRIEWLVPAGVLYAAWWAGPLAPAAVLFFLASCYALGRRFADGTTAVLAGASAWMLVLWCALHFRVNSWWVYGAAFAVPCLQGGFVPHIASNRAATARERSSFALLLFVLGTHLLAALKPEISSDGLSMHLALPAFVAHQGYWPFDHTHAIWSLMPAGADALYTGVYLLGGEAAAKLLNFAFLAITCALLVRIARRWTTPEGAYLCAALFASTPLVQLVTGSLFVENVWAALLLGAVIVMVEEGDSRVAGVLAGAAIAVKLIAVAFALPLAALALRGKSRIAALALALVFALPPYFFAYAKSGNPIFPFANAVFRSPDYDAKTSFKDPRFGDLHASWTAPYDLTFRSAMYVEGQGGAAGFQYFALLLPALLLLRKRDQAVIATVCVAGTGIVLLGAPNLRYAYAAMPLASLALTWLPLRAAASLGLIALNLWFLPSSGYYNPDFALFRKQGIAPFIAEKAPVRMLIEQLNREAPGQPAAFFSTDATAGLRAAAYTDTWHNENYWEHVRNAPDAAAIAEQFRTLGIHHVIAPTTREAPFEVVRGFLERWLDAETTVGPLTLYRLRDAAVPIPKDTRPVAPGTHDDSEPRIEYSGAWLHDKQFAEPVGHTLSYSDAAGDALKLTFEGRAITYIHTRAPNRGIGELWLDGRLARRINFYSPKTEWQSALTLAVRPGTHTFELRVTGRKDRKSSGTYVDLDAVTVVSATAP